MNHPGRLTPMIGILTISLLLPAARAAEGVEGLNSSLKSIPADAAFYSSMMHNREQVEAILHSRAWAKLMGLPAVQTFFQMMQAQLQQPGSPLASVKQFFDEPENRQLIQLLSDMGSEEIFFYGGESCV